jgi:MFS family permease
MAPFEALIPASVADIWHVHERGFRMAIFNLGVLGGINLAGPIGGCLSLLIDTESSRLIVHSWNRDPTGLLPGSYARNGWSFRPHAPPRNLLHA